MPPVPLSEDPSAARLLRRMGDGAAALMTATGADPGWGSRAHLAFRAAGFTGVGTELYASSATEGTLGGDLATLYWVSETPESMGADASAGTRSPMSLAPT